MGRLSSLGRTGCSGFVFGLALLFATVGFEKTSTSRREGAELSRASGLEVDVVYDDQYRFFYLVILFLTASIGSVGVIYFANSSGWTNIGPRNQASYGWFAFDGNVIGGILQGVGMAITMTEPGLVFVRAGMGHLDAWWTVFGGVLGGLSFVLVNHKLKRQANVGGAGKGSLTLQDGLEISTRSAVVGYEIFAVCLLVLLSLYVKEVGGDHESKWTTAVIGGGLLGLAQLASIILTGGTIGVSSAYPSFATHILRMLGDARPHPGYGSIAFACGLLMSGTCASAIYASASNLVQANSDRDLAVLGGFLMIFGSRIAGGCTSGHGLSGCGTLSTSSFVTLTALAIGGIMWKIAPV